MKKILLLKTLLLLAFIPLGIYVSYGQERVVTGIVNNEQGEPLSDVTLTVDASQRKVSTDSQGRFQLMLSDQEKSLTFSYIGMEAYHLIVDKRNHYLVALKAVSTMLDNTVVVGYGVVKKSDLTGAVQRLDREDLIREVPTNILQAMQGKLAGVNVTQNDGAPGAGLSVRIRGSNSFLGGTEPLYVIDGIPFNNSNSGATPQSIDEDDKQTLNVMSFLNPDDIESVDVLKDASAAAIYGSRGANGVVLITTRKGKAGKDKVEFNINTGIAGISKRLNVLDSREYAMFQNLAYENSNKYDGTAYTLPYAADYIGPLRNWQDEIFRQGLYQNYSVGISGGNDFGNHNITFNYLDQEGTINNSGYNRINLRLNLNRNLGSRFKLGSSTSIARSATDGVKTGTTKSDAASAGVIRSAITYPPTREENEPYENAGESFFITNPVIYTSDVLNRTNSLSIFSSNYLEVKLNEAFKFRQNLGMNYSSSLRDQYYPRTVYEGHTAQGYGLKSDNTWSSTVAESMLTYQKTYQKHDINAVVAGTYERTDSQWKRVEGKSFPNDLLENENMESAEQLMPIKGARSQSNLVSFLGRANYSYDDRYLLTMSLRRDGSSKFAKENKWANFSSFALAWKVINESFMSNVSPISDLKLRASYGQTGNQGIGSYSSLSKLSVYNYPFDGQLYSGLADELWSGPGNPTLIWETTTSYNAGIDLSLFANRLNLNVDVYLKNTDDLLQYVTTPSSTGFPRQLRNAGKVENKGLELTLQAVVVRKENFEWNSNFNISFNRNKILSLGDDVERQYAESISTNDEPFIQIVGKPIGALYGYVEDGYYDNEAEVRNHQLYTTQPDDIIRRMVGEVKYMNLDGDPTSISVNDQTFIGDVNPKYVFGFTNNFKYKRFDLSVFVNGVQGNDIINMNSRFNANIGSNKNILTTMNEGAWAEGKNNENATQPKVMRQFWRSFLFSRRFVEDGSFIRVKNLTLGYTLPSSLIKGVSSLRVSMGVNNLATFTNYSGYDPEVNSFGDNPALFGVDLGGYPTSRTYNFSVRCSF